MYKNTIIEAFRRQWQNKNVEFIAAQMEISSKTIYRMIRSFNIEYLIKDRSSKLKIINSRKR